MRQIAITWCIFFLVPIYALTDEELTSFYVERGVIREEENHEEYRLDNTILRQEMVAMILKSKGVKWKSHQDNCESQFEDIHDNHWSCTMTNVAIQHEVITDNRANFRPERSVSMVEALAFLFGPTCEEGLTYAKYFSHQTVHWKNRLKLLGYQHELIDDHEDFDEHERITRGTFLQMLYQVAGSGRLIYCDEPDLDASQFNHFKDPQSIKVDLGPNRLRYFEYGRLVNAYQISPGLPSMPTPIGSFQIHNKHPYARSQRSGIYMPYWMAFTADGVYGLHGVPEYSPGYKLPNAIENIGKPASHGCIRVLDHEVIDLYNWVRVGAKVYID